jgi:hypothetical protein
MTGLVELTCLIFVATYALVATEVVHRSSPPA